jgi:hypothetical protein
MISPMVKTAPNPPGATLIPQQSGLAKANLLLIYNKGLSPAIWHPACYG